MNCHLIFARKKGSKKSADKFWKNGEKKEETVEKKRRKKKNVKKTEFAYFLRVPKYWEP